MDYIERLFTDFDELHGDRAFADDAAIVGGIGNLDGQSVMVIGQQKGRGTKEKLKRNFGMPHPEGYRKAKRLMELANRFNIPIITFIDTAGAYPGIHAEARGQAEAIASNLLMMAELRVPVICVVIGEGCSGGALGIGVGDYLVMLEYSYYATISPEGCASILWKDAEKASHAASIMGITSKRLKDLSLVDEVIAEPLGGAHRHYDEAAQHVKVCLLQLLKELNSLSIEERVERRYQRIRHLGRYES
jgi:acetyl-CoA carboxylase carboxyl transferase subunit alpha